jgi:hypothetical protein
MGRVSRELAGSEAVIDPDVFALDPAQTFQSLPKGCRFGLTVKIVFGESDQRADAFRPRSLLCARRDWQSSCAAQPRDELPAPH